MKRGGHDRLVMSGFALPVVLALPIVLAACPQFLSDWSIVGGSGPDATTDGGGGGPDATTDGGGGGPEASSEAEAGGAWTPLAIKSQLAFWLDPASLVVDGGTQIGRWQDLSGNGNDAIQGNPAYDPTYNASGINGLPSATFTGPITFLTILDSPTMQWSTDDFVVLAVVRATASATEAMLYQKTGPPPYNGASLYLNQDKPSASTLAAAQVSGSIYVTSVPPPATFVDGSVHLVGARRSGLTLEIRVDGAVSNSLNSAAVAATDVSVAGVNAYIGQNGLANVAAGTAELHQLQ